MQKIIPNLWFDNRAEEAINFYTSVFKDSKIGDISRYSAEQAPNKEGHSGICRISIAGTKIYRNG